MKRRVTQGTIIEDIRSAKYSNIHCKGIVISARCDLAQEKIYNFHFLTAMNIEDWIYEVLFFDTIKDEMKNCYSQLKEFAKKNGYDYETMLQLGYKKTRLVIDRSGLKKKEKENIQKVLDAWENYGKSLSDEVSRKARKDILKKVSVKKIRAALTRLYNSHYPKYCFIPQKAYQAGESSVLGLVVDLQDVHQMDIKIINEILENKIDYQIVHEEPKRRKINENFFFENKGDFVIADSCIKSPWIEYLLQCFTISFTRIGVDNAETIEIEEFCDKLFEEEWK